MLEIACVSQAMYTFYTSSSLVYSLLLRDNHLKNISVDPLWRKGNYNMITRTYSWQLVIMINF